MFRRFFTYYYLYFIGIFLVFFVSSYFFLDPDFGWHIRMGELIMATGVPKFDPFSYTMPSFLFVDHEWLTNIFMAFLYKSIGFVGLNLLFSGLILVLVSFLFYKTRNNEDIGLSLVTLLVSTLLPFFGVRPQVVAWILVLCLNEILTKVKLWKRYRFIVPFIFLVWANLHGSFAFGIIILFLVLLFRFVRTKRLIISDLLVLVLSVSFTLINPYKAGIWREVLTQGFDFHLKFLIQEWKPAIFSFNFAFVGYSVASFYLIMRYRKRLLLEELAVYLFAFVLSLTSVRHIPLWTILAFPITIKSFVFLKEEILVDPISKRRFKKVIRYFGLATFVLFIFQGVINISGSYKFSESNFYPSKGVDYLKTNLPNKEIFSVYEWGGYLDWKQPEKRVFIDGRMPSWKRNNAPENEAKNAMEDYVAIFRGDIDFADLSLKYNIDTVLVPVSKNHTFANSLNDKLSRLLGVKRAKNLIQQFKDEGWVEVYKDNVAVIYKKT